MTEEPSAREDFIAWNEEMAHKYDPEAYHVRSSFLIRWIERRRVNTIVTLLASGKEDRVLEVGCGAGNVLERVPLGHLFGIDLSPYLLGKAKKRLAHRGSTWLSMSYGELLPFGDNSFEKLLCSEVLEHVPNPRDMVQEMRRVVKRDGTVVISVPNERLINRLKDVASALPLTRNSLAPQQGYQTPERMTDEWHLHDFDLPTLVDTVHGLVSIDRVKGIPFGFLPLRYVVCGRPLN
jgi:ubiquinone/menaquinone biosynthesis C-methylase UbiE